ncbi:MAG TPA: DUF6152 family protein [Vicinamibacterales bacterium]|jgi:hypothetical protein|nr:DUF6152 family protein [Vicinamibacterales bacterium]
MRLQRVLITTFAALLLIGTAVSAHHSFAAEFDSNKPIQLKGTVVRVEWINPHTWIHIAVKDADGKTEEWMIEGGTPNTLLRRGLTKNSLPEGTEIVVDGYRAKNGSNRANGRDVTFPDGRKLFMGSSGTGAPKDGRDSSER